MNEINAVKNINELVVITDEYGGQYLGLLGATFATQMGFFSEVQVKFCLTFPKQKSIFQNLIRSVKPKPYDSKARLETCKIEPYAFAEDLDVNLFSEDYYKYSVNHAIKNELDKYGCVDAREKQLLMQHIDELREEMRAI